MRLFQLIAFTALALVGLSLIDEQYANAAGPRFAVVQPASTVVQQRFGPLGFLRSTTVTSNAFVAAPFRAAPVLFRPAVAVRAPFTNVVVDPGFVRVRAPFVNVHVPLRAYTNQQLLVDPHHRLQLNRLNTYSYPVNSSANILYGRPQTVIIQEPPPQQLLIVPSQPAPAPIQVQPQSALPVQAVPLAVTQPAPVLAVQQPACIVQPVRRYGLALRGC